MTKRHQLQEIKMNLSQGNEEAIGVFVSGIETKQLGWSPKETISKVERMGEMELKICLITFKEKECHFILVKLTTCHNIVIVIRQLLRFVY